MQKFQVGQPLNLDLIPINNRGYFKARVYDNDNWIFWRPIVFRILSYTEASKMTVDELLESNAALDKYIIEKGQSRK